MTLYEVLNYFNDGYSQMSNKMILRNMARRLNLPYDTPIKITDFSSVVFPRENRPYSLAGISNDSVDYGIEIDAISWLNEHGGVLRGKVYLQDLYVANILVCHSIFKPVFMFYSWFCSEDLLEMWYREFNRIGEDRELNVNSVINDISIALFDGISRYYPVYPWGDLQSVQQYLINEDIKFKEQQAVNNSIRNNIAVSMNNGGGLASQPNEVVNKFNSGYVNKPSFGATARNVTANTAIGAGMMAKGTGEVVAGQAEKIAGRGVQAVGYGVEFGGKAVSGVGKGVEVVGKGVEYGGKGVEYAGRGIETVGRGIEVGGRGIETVGRGIETAGRGIETVGRGTETLGKGTQTFGKGTVTAGQGVVSAGSAINGVGSAINEAGIALDGTGIGAIVGVPLNILGVVTQAAGIATQGAGYVTQGAGHVTQGVGKAEEVMGKGEQEFSKGTQKFGQGVQKAGQGVQKAGQGVQKAGQEVQKVGVKIQDGGKAVQEVGHKIQDVGDNIQDKGRDIRARGQEIYDRGQDLQNNGFEDIHTGKNLIGNKQDYNDSLDNIIQTNDARDRLNERRKQQYEVNAENRRQQREYNKEQRASQREQEMQERKQYAENQLNKIDSRNPLNGQIDNSQIEEQSTIIEEDTPATE